MLIVWKLDRLARSMKQLTETIEKLRLRNIGFRSLHGGDRHDDGARRAGLSHVQRAGRVRACPHSGANTRRTCRSEARGPHRRPTAEADGGRPRCCENVRANPDIPVSEVADRLGVSPATLYAIARGKGRQIIVRARTRILAIRLPTSWRARIQVGRRGIDQVRRPDHSEQAQPFVRSDRTARECHELPRARAARVPNGDGAIGYR